VTATLTGTAVDGAETPVAGCVGGGRLLVDFESGFVGTITALGLP
jgi:hypothetical protein